MMHAESISLIKAHKAILSPVNLHIEQGRFTAIIGPNGAGKSTLLKLLSGMVKPSSGRVFFDGKSLTDYDDISLARRRAVLSQHQQIFSQYRAEEVVMLGRYPHIIGSPSRADRQAVTHAMQRTMSSHLAGRNMQTLSGGEAQRIHLARVMAQLNVPLGHTEEVALLLDEPLTGLDMKHQHSLLDLISDPAYDHFTVVAVLHDLHLAVRYADRLIVMKEGNIVADGTPKEILKEELLSDVYDLDLRIVRRDDDIFVLPGKMKTKNDAIFRQNKSQRIS